MLTTLIHSPALLTAALVAAVLVGLSKGGLSIVGNLAVPVMALVISPIVAAGLLLPIYVISDMFGLWVYRREFSRRNLKILVPAAIVGVGVGWATASIVSERWVTLLIGVIGLLFCLNSWLRHRRQAEAQPAEVPRGVAWGILTGFTSFVSHSGGPPFQMYVLPQHLPKMVFAGTSTILFAIVNAVKLVPYWALGQLSFDSLSAVVLLGPAAIAGTFAGAAILKIIPQKQFFLIIQVTLFLLSIKLVYDGIVG